MRKMTCLLASAGILFAPIGASAAQSETVDVRPGAFVGARFQIALGGKQASRPRASLAIAPTLTRQTYGSVVRTSMGEGLALNLGREPTLTLAGIRADQALGLASSKNVDAEHKLGVSTGGWIAIGIGVVAIAGGLYFLHLVDEAEDNSD